MELLVLHFPRQVNRYKNIHHSFNLNFVAAWKISPCLFAIHILFYLCLVNVRMSKPVENFYEFIWAKLTTIAGKQNLKCSLEWQFCNFFYASEIRKEM